MKHIITIFLSIMAVVANGQKITDKIITVEPHLSFQNYEHFKRLVLNSPDSHIEYLDGFDFQWGYRCEISVKETELKERLTDGTKYAYSLNRIISKTKVTDTVQFFLFLDSKRYYHDLDADEQEMNNTLIQENDSTFLYFNAVEIEVPEHFKDAFNLIVEGSSTKMGTFIFINDKRIRLIGL